VKNVQVDVIPCINEARSDDFIHKTVIVVDVLRATSSIITALVNGCSGIIPVGTVCQARNLQSEGDLLGGERFCKKIAGFDLGNSPIEYQQADIEGKRIIMTTTNGIRAIQKSHKADHILAGALINASSCANADNELNRDIVIICAGTQDEFSLEDGLGAGLIINELINIHPDKTVELNDFGIAMHSSYIHFREHLQAAILDCSNGKKLKKLGFEEDIILCTHVNLFSLVPILRNDILMPYEVLKL
jgi:2-phosphosulfolactate phosphatase